MVLKLLLRCFACCQCIHIGIADLWNDWGAARVGRPSGDAVVRYPSGKGVLFLVDKTDVLGTCFFVSSQCYSGKIQGFSVTCVLYEIS